MTSNPRQFSISEAAALTGLSPHVIRKWEDRHQVVVPQRSPGGDRRYLDADIDHLTALKRLVDKGHSIGQIARWDQQQLLAARTNADLPGRRVRLAVIGEVTAAAIDKLAGRIQIKLVVSATKPENVSNCHPDLLILEKSSLDETIFRELSALRQQIGVQKIIVLYGFATTRLTATLSNDDTACLRMPVNYRELERTIQALTQFQADETPAVSSGSASQVPKHRYSTEVLARVASLSPTLNCECPRHVAELIVALSGFEKYSARCKSNNPQDARVHQELERTAAVARAAFESALDMLARHENIPLAQWQHGEQSLTN